MQRFRKPAPKPKVKRVKAEGPERAKLRARLAKDAHYHCETCDTYLPLFWEGRFDLYRCGHTSHIKSAGSGGPDTVANCKYECWTCHRGKHDGKKFYRED